MLDTFPHADDGIKDISPLYECLLLGSNPRMEETRKHVCQGLSKDFIGRSEVGNMSPIAQVDLIIPFMNKFNDSLIYDFA